MNILDNFERYFLLSYFLCQKSSVTDPVRILPDLELDPRWFSGTRNVWHQKYETKNKYLKYSFNRISKISICLRYRAPYPFFLIVLKSFGLCRIGSELLSKLAERHSLIDTTLNVRVSWQRFGTKNQKYTTTKIKGLNLAHLKNVHHFELFKLLCK